MIHWLYSANLKLYDVQGAMAAAATYWPMTSKVSPGDRLFLYLSAPEKRLAYDCRVTATGLREAEVIGAVRPFFRDRPKGGGRKKAFMRLQAICRLPDAPDGPFCLAALKQAGLTGMLMGPRKLDNTPGLLAHILEHLDD